MSLSIYSLNTYLLGFSSQLSAAYTSSSIKQNGDLASQVSETITSRRSANPLEQDLQAVLSIFSDKTRILHESFHSFKFPEGDLPNHYRTATVSDPGKLTAQAALDATPTNYLMEIDRLAATQTNRSSLLASNEITDLDEGTYTFTLTAGDTSHSLEVDINKSGLHPDTNKDVLKKLERRINQVDDSLEAFVTETQRKVYSTLSDNLTEKVVYLTIRNKNTGSSTPFSLEDETGTIVDTLKVNHVTQSGQPAQYRLNSSLFTAETNTGAADSGKLTFGFLDTTQEPVMTTVKAGLTPAEGRVVDLLLAFNGYLNWLDEKSRYFKPSLKIGILEEMNAAERTLQGIGLGFDENGLISANSKFTNAFEGNVSQVREALTGEKGFFTLMATRLEEIIDNGVQNYAASPEETGVDLLV